MPDCKIVHTDNGLALDMKPEVRAQIDKELSKIREGRRDPQVDNFHVIEITPFSMPERGGR